MGEFARVIIEGLNYWGSGLDIAINYLLLAAVLVPFFRYPELDALSGRRGWKSCLLVFALLQVWVWFSQDASGISLIWSALAGYLLVSHWKDGATGLFRTGRESTRPVRALPTSQPANQRNVFGLWLVVLIKKQQPFLHRVVSRRGISSML